MNHFLDIIVPEYDCKEEYIKRLLHSISRQKNVDFEEIGVIIVNDKSKNKLRKGIFKNYPKLNIEYYFKENNEGVGLTRQYGLDKSTAKYVTFVDQDDELFGNDSLGKIINNLKAYNFNYICTEYIEEVKNTLGGYVNIKCDKTDTRETLHGVFIKREFLINNNIRFMPGYRVHDDFYLKRVLKSVETPVYVEIVSYLWKYNLDSQVRKKRKYNYLVETFDEYFRATKESNEFKVGSQKYNSINIVSSLIGLFILLESNLFDGDDLKEKRIFYRKELFELIVKYNEIIELDKNRIDSIFSSQLKVMLESEPSIKIDISFFDFIDKMKKRYPEMKYKSINCQRILDIIVPYYNADDVLIESLMNSIMGQSNISLSEIGVIFVSDNSPKDIPDYILKEKYPIINIEYYKKDVNEGQGLARQYGFEKSKAKYVTYLDQDDMLFGPDALSIIISALKTNDIEMLFTDYYRWNPKNNTKTIITYKELQCLHGVFFNREKVIEKGLKFSDKFRMYEDTYYMIIASRIFDAKYIQYPTYIWRKNDSSQTEILNVNTMMIVDKFSDYILANTEAIKFLIDKNIIDENVSKNVLYILFGLLTSNLFKGKELSAYKKSLYDYYLYLTNYFDFKDETEIINNSFNFIKKGYVTEVYGNFDDFIKEMKDKYN